MRYSTVDQDVQATSVWIENGWVCLRLSDEREIRFPTYKNRRLRQATPNQLSHVELICDGTGIHWNELDEDLSVQGILEGRFGQE